MVTFTGEGFHPLLYDLDWGGGGVICCTTSVVTRDCVFVFVAHKPTGIKMNWRKNKQYLMFAVAAVTNPVNPDGEKSTVYTGSQFMSYVKSTIKPLPM